MVYGAGLCTQPEPVPLLSLQRKRSDRQDCYRVAVSRLSLPLPGPFGARQVDPFGSLPRSARFPVLIWVASGGYLLVPGDLPPAEDGGRVCSAHHPGVFLRLVPDTGACGEADGDARRGVCAAHYLEFAGV